MIITPKDCSLFHYYLNRGRRRKKISNLQMYRLVLSTHSYDRRDFPLTSLLISESLITRYIAYFTLGQYIETVRPFVTYIMRHVAYFQQPSRWKQTE